MVAMCSAMFAGLRSVMAFRVIAIVAFALIAAFAFLSSPWATPDASGDSLFCLPRALLLLALCALLALL